MVENVITKAGRQYILNPRTGKYVLLDGKVGKQVVMDQQQTPPRYLDNNLMKKIADIASPKTQLALKATNSTMNAMIPTPQTNYKFFLRTLQDAKVTPLPQRNTFKLFNPTGSPTEVLIYVPPPKLNTYVSDTVPLNFTIVTRGKEIVRGHPFAKPFVPPPKTTKAFQEVFRTVTHVRISWNPQLEKEWNLFLKRTINDTF